MTKKLYYITTSRIPTQRAHGLHIMKMCESFSRAGFSVELVIPRFRNELSEDPFLYYNAEKNFSIRQLWTLDWAPKREPASTIFYWISAFSFAWSTFWFVLRRKNSFFYFRYDRPLLWAFFPFFRRRNISCEAHFLIEGRMRRIMMRSDNIIVVNREAKRVYDQVTDLEEKVLVVPDGVSLKDYDLLPSKEEARRELGMPQDKKIVLYTGYFYSWKGVDTIVRGATAFPTDTELWLVGGFEDKKPLEKLVRDMQLTNVHFVEHRPYREIPRYQKAADVLAIGGTLKSKESQFFTSPLKAFEYMASGNPIIAPRTPAIEEILYDEKNALLVTPDDPQALAKGILRLLSDTFLAKKISKQAQQDVREYDWDKRAVRIKKFIEDRAVATRVLYLFAGERRWMVERWRAGKLADSQLVGLNDIHQFGIRARFYETSLMKRLRKINFHLAQLPALFVIRQYNAVFLGSNLFFVFLVKYILRWKKPKFIFYNTFFTNTLKRNRTGMYAWIIRKAIASLDCIMCPSTAQRQFLIDAGFDAKRIVFIPNGVDAEFFKPSVEIIHGKPTILSIGKDMGRDYQTLFEATVGLAVQLVIVSAPRNLKNIKIPAGATLHYDMPQEETRALYRDATLVVLPTFPEDTHFDASDCSGQYVLLESMAAGKAVVASVRSTLSDYLEDGKNGMMVPSSDPKKLQDAIVFLLEHPKERHELAVEARNYIEQHGTTVALAKSLSTVFKHIA